MSKKGKEFVCEICGRTFRSREALERHVEEVHGEEEEPWEEEEEEEWEEEEEEGEEEEEEYRRRRR